MSKKGRKRVDLWKFFEEVDERRIKCTLCEHVFVGGGSRIEAHLKGIKGRGVKVCSKFTSENGTNEMDETVEMSSVSGSNKRAKTISSSTKQGLPIADITSSSNQLNEKVKVDEREAEGLTLQATHVKNDAEEGELLLIDESIKSPYQVGPFSILHSVDADDRKLIHYVFDPKLDPSEVIVSYSLSSLNRSEFTTLRPGDYLDDLVISIVAQNLTNVESNKRFNWYLPIWFSRKALGDVSHFMEFVHTQNIRETYMSNLVNCHMIFIPIHIGPDLEGHFYLYVIDVKKEIVEIWDSFPEYTDMKNREDNVRKILIALDNLFLDDIKHNFPEGWAFAKFNAVMAEDIPKQPNGFDCGIFVIKFMKSAGDKRRLTSKFQSDDERFNLAKDLLNDERNKTRETLLKKAKEKHDLNKEDLHASVLPNIPEKLQQKEPEDFTALNVLGGGFDLSLLLLKENVKALTSLGSYARKQLEQLGSQPRTNSKSEVEKWLENIDQRKNQVVRLVEEVKRSAEDIGKLVGEGLPAHLRLGDHELSDDPLRTEEPKHTLAKPDYNRCFLYSAFYPENKEIIRQELIMNFIDEGLIYGNSLEAQFAEGHTILDKLEENHLMEGGSFHPLEEYTLGGENDPDEKWLKGGIVDPEIKWVKMSGDSRVKAVSIIKENPGLMVEAGLRLKEIPHQRRWSDMEKVSLMHNLIEEIPRGISLKCPKLSTLIIQHNPLKRIPDSFFSYMPALRGLDLSYTNIKVLPNSISNLKSLSSLLLKSCLELQSVPPLGSLQGLMRLDLSSTKISEVPKGLEMLVKLRWLDFSYSALLEVDTQFLIPKLTNLQSLVLNWSSGRMKVKGKDLEGLKQLETFAGNLYNVDNFNTYVRAMLALDFRPRNYLLQLGTSNPWNPTFGKAVIFVHCNILRRSALTLVLPFDVEQLYITSCRQWRSLCHVFSFNNATSLKYCEISECDELENLFCFSYTCSFCSSLKNLASLKLSAVENLKFLWKETETLSSGTLNRLRFVKISTCDSLKTLLTPKLLESLQSLEKLYVEYCGELEEIFSVTDMEQIGEKLSGADQSHGNNSSDQTKFFLPNLVSLVLWELPKLTSVCRGEMHCDSMKDFRIGVCPKLDSLPRTVPWVQIEVSL